MDGDEKTLPLLSPEGREVSTGDEEAPEDEWETSVVGEQCRIVSLEEERYCRSDEKDSRDGERCLILGLSVG